MKRLIQYIMILFIMVIITYCNRVADDTPAGVLVRVSSITATSSNGETGSIMYSDVIYKDSVVNDVADITFSNDLLNQSVSPSFFNNVIMTRYRVTYLRSDGRNTPGIDVPYPFDEVMNIEIPASGTASTGITIVRAQAKLESPLYELRTGGSESVISTQAKLDFWGHDLAGRNLTTTGYLEVLFANWADE